MTETRVNKGIFLIWVAMLITLLAHQVTTHYYINRLITSTQSYMDVTQEAIDLMRQYQNLRERQHDVMMRRLDLIERELNK